MIKHKRQMTFREEIVLEPGTNSEPNVLVITGSSIAVNSIQSWILNLGASYHVYDSYTT